MGPRLGDGSISKKCMIMDPSRLYNGSSGNKYNMYIHIHHRFTVVTYSYIDDEVTEIICIQTTH